MASLRLVCAKRLSSCRSPSYSGDKTARAFGWVEVFIKLNRPGFRGGIGQERVKSIPSTQANGLMGNPLQDLAKRHTGSGLYVQMLSGPFPLRND